MQGIKCAKVMEHEKDEQEDTNELFLEGLRLNSRRSRIRVECQKKVREQGSVEKEGISVRC